jgi:hypothetical protein
MFAQRNQIRRRSILVTAIGSGLFWCVVGVPVQGQGPTVIPGDDGSGYSVTLWPANDNWRLLKLSDLVLSAVDADGHAIDVDVFGQLVTITSDEPATDPADDMAISSPATAAVRAKRDGAADGRVYTFRFLIFDQSGNATAAASRAQVPRAPKKPAIDSGPHACVGPGC